MTRKEDTDKLGSGPEYSCNDPVSNYTFSFADLDEERINIQACSGLIRPEPQGDGPDLNPNGFESTIARAFVNS